MPGFQEDPVDFTIGSARSLHNSSVLAEGVATVGCEGRGAEGAFVTNSSRGAATAGSEVVGAEVSVVPGRVDSARVGAGSVRRPLFLGFEMEVMMIPGGL
ncbi:MAG: hypothetical protein WBV82_08725 [Myxococcaceae bacterium]